MPVVADATAFRRLWQRFHTAVGAWQPLTGRGIAAFAAASGLRILLFQGIMAALVAVALVWSVRRIAFPTIESALTALPRDPAGIQDRGLRWPEVGPVLLAQCPQLALGIDTESSGSLGLNGDLQLELGTRTLVVRGLLGQSAFSYPPALELPLDRIGAVAAWGAWRLPLLALLGVAAFGSPLAVWWLLASVYFLPAWILAWALRRQLSLSGAWRLCSAALWPAAVLPGIGLLLYATLWIRLPGLAALWILHLPAGWVWIVWAMLTLPSGTPRRNIAAPNPFVPASTAAGGKARRTSGTRKNPFAG